MYYFKNKKKKRKGKKIYVAQQRVYLTKKEGFLGLLPNKRMLALF